MKVSVIQALPSDPRYKKIDNQVLVQFGRVIFNWKPNSVNKLMRFFLAKAPGQKKAQPKESEDEIEIMSMGSLSHI